MRVAVEIALSEDEIAHLSKLSKSRSISVRLAERSRIILLAGEGMTNEEIGNELGITRQKAGRWRKRYAESGIDGISQDASRPGRKPKISSRKVSKVIELTTQTTPENATHWSQRLMAEKVNVSMSNVSALKSASIISALPSKYFPLFTSTGESHGETTNLRVGRVLATANNCLAGIRPIPESLLRGQRDQFPSVWLLAT